MFSILMTSLTDKPPILQWEVWLASLLGLKGLTSIFQLHFFKRTVFEILIGIPDCFIGIPDCFIGIPDCFIGIPDCFIGIPDCYRDSRLL